MTVSSSITQELEVDQIVLLAYRISGLLSIYEALGTTEAGAGRLFLDVIVKDLEKRGVQARSQSTYELELTSGTATYDLPGAHSEVHGDAMYIHSDESETMIHPIGQQAYESITNKDTEGVPSLYYPSRNGSLTRVTFWQVPAEDASVRFRTLRLFASNLEGEATPDLDRHWEKYLIHELAAYLCRASNKQKDSVLYSTIAEKAFLDARRASASKGPRQMVVVHPTPWNR